MIDSKNSFDSRSGNKISDLMREMNVGDSISFDVTRAASIRAMASTYSLVLRKRFITKLDREKKRIVMTRTE